MIVGHIRQVRQEASQLWDDLETVMLKKKKGREDDV